MPEPRDAQRRRPAPKRWTLPAGPAPRQASTRTTSSRRRPGVHERRGLAAALARLDAAIVVARASRRATAVPAPSSPRSGLPTPITSAAPSLLAAARASGSASRRRCTGRSCGSPARTARSARSCGRSRRGGTKRHRSFSIVFWFCDVGGTIFASTGSSPSASMRVAVVEDARAAPRWRRGRCRRAARPRRAGASGGS